MISHDDHLWLQMWRNKQTDDFHQILVNKHLVRFWPALNIPHGKKIFVPLCGKSLDILWLAEQGYKVIGVELSPIAVKAFFKENHLQPVKRKLADFSLWTHGNISILCGNYFALNKSILGQIDTVYDRAALTALPKDIRSLYVSHLHTIVSETTNIFLLTIEDTADNRHLNFSEQVDAELISLYASDFEIELKHVESVVEDQVSTSPPATQHVTYKVYHLSARTASA
ncbi:MAG: thiopurine S-methyltransferase [Gammaproteobacteria bacterium]